MAQHTTTQHSTQHTTQHTTTGISRRHLIGGAATVGAVPLLAACGSDDSASDSPASSAPATSADAPSSAPAAGTSSGGGTPAASGLVPTSDVPVGGGVILAKDDVVVVQPEKGAFLGWSATCTHMGCTVGTVSDGLIHCPCHGSEYSIRDGSVSRGPATQGLAKVALVVKGAEVDKA